MKKPNSLRKINPDEKEINSEVKEEIKKEHISSEHNLEEYTSKNFQKSNQKNKPKRKKIKLVSIILICAIIIAVIYFGYLNLRFSIKEDLIITIQKRHIDMNIDANSPAELEISSNVQTSIFCKAECSHTLKSLSSGETVYSDKFQFRRFHKIYLEQKLYPYISGEGQDIYTYSISCTNLPTANCPVKDSNIEQNIIITINRKLTAEEERLKQIQAELLGNAYEIFNKGTYEIDWTEDAINKMEFAKKDDLQRNISESKIKKAEFENALSKTTDAWLTYNHSITQSSIEIERIPELEREFETSASQLYNKTNRRIEEHNTAVNLTYALAEMLFQSEKSVNSAEQFISSEQNKRYLNSELNETGSLLNYVSRSITNKNIKSYEDLFNVLQTANLSINLLEEEYVNSLTNNSKFAQAQIDLIFAKEDICLIQNSKSSNNTSNLNNLNATQLNNTSCAINSSSEIINYSNSNYTYFSTQVVSFCEEYSQTTTQKLILQREQERKRANLSSNTLSEINRQSAEYRIYILKKHLQELQNRTDYAAVEASKKINEHINFLENTNNISSSNINLITFNNSFNISSIYYFLPENITFSGIELCREIRNKTININLSLEQISPFNLTIDSEQYQKRLPELLPRACTYNVCNPYLNNSSKNYPLIIVHGHGFYTKNTRVTPTQVHNELQNQLFDDRLYVPAGVMREEEKTVINSLGYADISFVYKASYYPPEIIDNESIHLFADRLNGIIQNAKDETDKDKVILIVHSMGGLVTRAYLKEYGTEDVEAVIIGGTPNYGVTSETVKLCKLFGRDLECDEMYEQSKFISELKDEPYYDIPIYTLRGVGCPTFGADGDGIVASDKVPLPYAENYAFNGTCSLTGGFHVNLLSPKHNPEIYSKLKEILIENKN